MANADTLYYFVHFADSGDVWSGYVVDDGTYGYAVGTWFEDAYDSGLYFIYDAAALGYDSDHTGYVGLDGSYYDSLTETWSYAWGYGWYGLGSEWGYAYDGVSYDWFGYGETADLTADDTVYYFVYYADSGDVWYGYVFDDGSYGYYEGGWFDSPYDSGLYFVYASDALGEDVWYTGYVGVGGSYYDADTGTWAYAWGYGWNGLGSELGWAYADDWASYDWFGYGYDATLPYDTVYYFAYYGADGAIYYGYVYDDGSYGYAVGDWIADTAGDGWYYVYASYALGYDSPYTGYVGVSGSYYDDGGDAGYAAGYGWSGLGSEAGVTYGGGGATGWFGHSDGGILPAGDGPSDSVHYFAYYADSGDIYYGYVVDDGTYGYAAGDRIDGQGGSYLIIASVDLGYDAGNTGHVGIAGSAYYDSASDSWGWAYGYGDDGLGSESGWASGADLWTYDWFGPGDDADLGGAGGGDALYHFVYYYNSGDAYEGYVYDDGSYGYAVGQVIETAAGAYWIDEATSLGYQSGLAGYVSVYGDYYDADSGIMGYAWGYGWSGLGSEAGSAYGDEWWWWETFDPSDEADLAAGETAITVYYFAFAATSGDLWYGYVYDDGSYGYAVGQVIDTVYGSYTITASGVPGESVVYDGLGVAAERVEAWPAGTVVVSGDYYDADSGAWGWAWGSGAEGLGSESGTAYSGDWLSYDWFSPAEDADFAAAGGPVDSVFSFTFTFATGDTYAGYVYDDGTYGYAVGQVIDLGYGQYVITEARSLGYDSVGTGYVSVSGDYYDAESGDTGWAWGWGESGLGSEIGWAYSDDWWFSDEFGHGEAADFSLDVEGDVAWYFSFTATSGDSYYGYVIDDGTYGYAEGTVTTAFGTYEIYAAYAYGYDTGAAGFVRVETSYYDAQSDGWGYAFGTGWDGLGSEAGIAIGGDWTSYGGFGPGYGADFVSAVPDDGLDDLLGAVM